LTAAYEILQSFKKELRLYFGSFIAYSLATAFLLLTGYFFYTDMVFYDLFGDFMDITSSLWVYYFQDVRFVTLIILPLLTMRLFAEEKKLGTIELLWTYPLKDPQIILGKFSPAFSFMPSWCSVRLFIYCFYQLFTSRGVLPLCGLLRAASSGGDLLLAGHLFLLTETKSSAPCLLTASFFLVSNGTRKRLTRQLIGTISRFSRSL
jgi:ABC-2 type transport system permease protein